jgi:hypothetical protein
MPDFHGYPAASLRSDQLRVDYLTQAGPRIVGLYLADSNENLLSEAPSVDLNTDAGMHKLFGGHRIWAAPELPGWSYVPDSAGGRVEESGDGVAINWEAQGPGFAVGMRIKLVPGKASLELEQTLTNRYDSFQRLALWGITILPHGGVAYLPKAPGASEVRWPYTPSSDPRIKSQPALVEIQGQPGAMAKVGAFSPAGVCAYMRNEVLLLKRFEVQTGEHPDGGCNVEVYCDGSYLELETLGPLSDVPPGGSLTLRETWDVLAGDAAHDRLARLVASGR